MRFVSLCSGIEAATLAWIPLGWQCVAVAEIEKFPCAVLKHHYPDVPNLGDVNLITREQVESLGAVDVVIFGFPCQDLSNAGKRKGLKDADGNVTRSGLFFKCFEVARWTKARWIVVENVPGLFSGHGGRDFAAVVGELAGAKFDIPRDGWENAGFALGQNGLVEWCVLDAQYMHLAQRRERVFFVLDTGDWANRPPLLPDWSCLHWHPAPSRETRERIAPTIAARTNGGGGLGTDFDCDGGVIQCASTEDLSPAIGAENPTAIAFETRMVRTTGGQPQEELTHALKASAGSGDGAPCVSFKMAVRRLTPRECERLQGFPGDFTKIPWRGKPAEKCPDGNRYKALGNSMAVPNIRWIGMQIERVMKYAK